MNKPFLVTIAVLIAACGILAFLWQGADKEAVKLSGDLRTEKAERVDLQGRYNQLSGQFNTTVTAQEQEIKTLKASMDLADSSIAQLLQQQQEIDENLQIHQQDMVEAERKDKSYADFRQTPLHPAVCAKRGVCD